MQIDEFQLFQAYLATPVGQQEFKQLNSAIVENDTHDRMDLPDAGSAYLSTNSEIAGMPGVSRRTTYWVVPDANGNGSHTGFICPDLEEGKQRAREALVRQVIVRRFEGVAAA